MSNKVNNLSKSNICRTGLIITIIGLFIVIVLLYIHLNTVYHQDINVINGTISITGSNISFNEIIIADNNYLLRDEKNNYYIFNEDNGLITDSIYKDAIVVKIIDNDTLDKKGIIVTKDKETWFLINNYGNFEKKVYSDLTIDHSITTINVSGTFPIALKKINIK